jgi:hypothetical protein
MLLLLLMVMMMMMMMMINPDFFSSFLETKGRHKAGKTRF